MKLKGEYECILLGESQNLTVEKGENLPGLLSVSKRSKKEK